MFANHRLTFALFLATSCVMISFIDSAPSAFQPYECTKALDCGPGECCVLGMMRYSSPSCLRVGKEGDYCLGTNAPRNLTLSYPNGLTLNISEVFTLFCPCDETMALSCRQGMCQSRIETDTDNHII